MTYRPAVIAVLLAACGSSGTATTHRNTDPPFEIDVPAGARVKPVKVEGAMHLLVIEGGGGDLIRVEWRPLGSEDTLQRQVERRLAASAREVIEEQHAQPDGGLYLRTAFSEGNGGPLYRNAYVFTSSAGYEVACEASWRDDDASALDRACETLRAPAAMPARTP